MVKAIYTENRGINIIMRLALAAEGSVNKKLEEEENARYEARQAERKRKMEEAKVLQEQQRQQAEVQLGQGLGNGLVLVFARDINIVSHNGFHLYVSS